MAGDIVHDLFTVFISKTLPNAHFVYKRFLCSRFPVGSATCDGAKPLRRPQGDSYKSSELRRYFFGIARRIKSPSQSGFATPSR